MWDKVSVSSIMEAVAGGGWTPVCNSFVKIFGDLLILSWSGETIKSVPAFVKTPHLEGFRASDWDFSPLHNWDCIVDGGGRGGGE